jgi:hypothetical protein
MSVIKLGSSDRATVRIIQQVVGVKPDGIFGPKTMNAVVHWQRQNNLTADGIVGPQTMEAMGILDTDLKNVSQYTTDEGLIIQKHFLPKGEYVKENYKIQNDYVFLHHTAGNSNPFATIDSWGRDDRGRVATEFVLGGQNHKTGDDRYDGVMVQAFPEGCQGFHLGRTGSLYMNKHSVGLEICAMGYLTEDYKTYVGSQAIKSQVSKLEEPFRKRIYYHRYSNKQIEATKKWLLYIANRDNIDIDQGLIPWIKKFGPTKAFGFHQDAYEGKVKGLLSHCNVRKDKTDVFPQPELVDMLLSI